LVVRCPLLVGELEIREGSTNQHCCPAKCLPDRLAEVVFDIHPILQVGDIQLARLLLRQQPPQPADRRQNRCQRHQRQDGNGDDRQGVRQATTTAPTKPRSPTAAPAP
jgi:hypothetical protein